MPRRSIHNHEKSMVALNKRIKRSNMPLDNKRIMSDYERHCVVEGLSRARRFKLSSHIYVFGTRYFVAPFRPATREQIWDAVMKIEASDLAPWTKHDYKVAIRKFIKFVKWGDKALLRQGYPKEVAGISTAIKKRDRVRIKSGDILTEEEIEQLLAATTNPQDKALIILMYEMGARVDELGMMTIGSVSRDKYSYICDINGKTGPRNPRVILSAGALTSWLNMHPRARDPSAALWGHRGTQGWKHYQYQAIRDRIKRLARNAGITKRVHPHLFRHSRITHVLKHREMNLAQVKAYFGYAPDSDIISSTYTHLVCEDVNQALLDFYGIKTSPETQRRTPPRCGMCGEVNDTQSRFCARCGYALDQTAPNNAEERVDTAGEQVTRFLNQPGKEEAFREMILAEIQRALSGSPPPQSSRSAKPKPGSSARRPKA